MSAQKSEQLTAAAKSLLERAEPLVREGGISQELRRYFQAASRVARRVVENDLTSKEACRDIRQYRYLSQGMIAATTLVAREAEVEPGSHFPGMDRYLCMAGCVGAYNKCMGRDGGGGDDGGDEPKDVGSDEPDDGGDDGGSLDGLGCYLAYASCLAGCTPPTS